MLVLAVGLVLLTAGMVGAAVGTAIVARHQAQVAADFAALAGAAYAINGETVACARADALAVEYAPNSPAAASYWATV